MAVSHLYSMLLLIRYCVYGVRIVVSADAWSSVDYCSGRADCLAFLLLLRKAGAAALTGEA